MLLLISRKAGLITHNGTLEKQVLSCLTLPPSFFFTLVFITEHDLMLYNMGYPFGLSGSAILAAFPPILCTPILLTYAYCKERYSRAYRSFIKLHCSCVTINSVPRLCPNMYVPNDTNTYFVKNDLFSFHSFQQEIETISIYIRLKYSNDAQSWHRF